MTGKLIVASWHGTIVPNQDDAAQNLMLASAAIDGLCSFYYQEAIQGKKHRYQELGRLFLSKNVVRRNINNSYNNGKSEKFVYEILNENLIKGKPLSFVNDQVDIYANHLAENMDKRVLISMKRSRNIVTKTAIVSHAYDYCIQKTLEQAGYSKSIDRVVANRLVTEKQEGQEPRIITGFTTDFNNAADALEYLFATKECKFLPGNTIFIGSENDESVANMLPRGHFIVSLLADDDFRTYMAARYAAKTPVTQTSLETYLGKPIESLAA